MYTPSRTSREQTSANGSAFNSYYTRPTVLLPRHNIKTGHESANSSYSYVTATNQTHLYTPNRLGIDTVSNIASRMKSSMVVETPKHSDLRAPSEQQQYTPNLKLSMLDETRDSLRTECSERTNVSRTPRDTNIEARLRFENNNLKEENRLLREEVEYLRQKYTATLIRKYKPNCKELFD